MDYLLGVKESVMQIDLLRNKQMQLSKKLKRKNTTNTYYKKPTTTYKKWTHVHYWNRQLKRRQTKLDWSPTTTLDFHKILYDQEQLLLLLRKDTVKPNDIQITYSRSAKLRDILKQGNLETPHLPKWCQPCLKLRCKTCQHVSPWTHIDNRKHVYLIRSGYNCQSKNIVYVLTGDICNKQYVQETEQTLNQRCR